MLTINLLKKTCRKCNRNLGVDEFTKNRWNKKGVGAYCRPCWAAIKNKEYHEKPGRKKEVNDRSLKWSMANWEKSRRIKRKSVLKLRYGISVERFEAMLTEQGGVCAICKKVEAALDSSGYPRSLAVDHCHKTGDVRGLLCFFCNTLIGKFGDDYSRLAEWLASASGYLAKITNGGVM